MAVTVSAAAAAPPSRARKPKDDGKPLPRAVSTSERQSALIEIAAIPVAACIATGRLADAGTIETYWPSFATELANLAESQAGLARWIDPLCKVGPYTKILSVGLPMLYQFAVNSGKAPAGAMGSVSPAMIAAQVELRIARAEAEALKEQLAAEADARETRAEIEKTRSQMQAA